MNPKASTAPNRRRNPAAAARSGAAVPFPFLNPAYPVKPWIDPVSGASFQTVTLRLDDGRFLAAIADRPEVRATAATQGAAEKAVMRKYKAARVGNPDPEEDEADDLAVIKRRQRGRFLTLEEVLARHGR